MEDDMADDNDDKARQREELDLTLENQARWKDLELRGMTAHGKSEDLDPAVENVFLNHIEMMEEAMEHPFCKVRDLFPDDLSFPPPEELDDEQIKALMDRIEETLAEKQIYFELNAGVPEREVYRHFIEEVRRLSPSTPVTLCAATQRMWAALADVLDHTPWNYVCNCGPHCTPGLKAIHSVTGPDAHRIRQAATLGRIPSS